MRKLLLKIRTQCRAIARATEEAPKVVISSAWHGDDNGEDYDVYCTTDLDYIPIQPRCPNHTVVPTLLLGPIVHAQRQSALHDKLGLKVWVSERPHSAPLARGGLTMPSSVDCLQPVATAAPIGTPYSLSY